ncbi:MAG: XisH family protein [Gemmataceae bacterium]|nr:XisH family protein [Gemmataceae bacterium]
MPARDTYHDAARNALVRDAWSITHDPFQMAWGEKDMYVDFAAVQMLVAQRSNRRIAVEVKSFLGKSFMTDLERALGQFVLYRAVLARREPDWELLLAIPFDVAVIFKEPLGQLLVESNLVRAIVFDPVQEVITRWIP